MNIAQQQPQQTNKQPIKYQSFKGENARKRPDVQCDLDSLQSIE